MGSESHSERTYVPLHVREGSAWTKFGWWIKGCREALARKLAPWLPTQASYEDAIRDGLAACSRLDAENEELRDALRLFGERVERDRREPDKVLAYALDAQRRSAR